MSYFSLFPYSVWECWWLAPLAFLLDARFGDPALPWPHPACLVGRLLNNLEARGRAGEKVGCARLSGCACLLALVLCAALAVRVCVALPVLGAALALYFAWAGLALGSLLAAGREVIGHVETSTVPEARKALSGLVSRDVSAMERPLLRKTLADTLSENFTDAFLAPYFWLLVAGPVGLWCYKAVSTGDSMWGYVTEQWRRLGWAFARCDDALAYIPARLSVLVLWATDRLCRAVPALRQWDGPWPGFVQIARQARGMPSPNSGWSMAACAWLCNARMAGPSVYFGALVDKAWMGPPEKTAAPWDEARLRALLALLRAGGVVGAALVWLVFCVLR
jgi:adenosylcobinamide-phosphate synthase